MKALLVALLIAAGCSPSAVTDWHGFPVRQIDAAGQTLSVAVASTSAQRKQGLSGVTTLDGIDGMLFEFPDITTTRFWMKDTLIPLDIAFFGDDGELIQVLSMPLCTTDPCPTYGPSDPYRWAIEAPAGGRLSTLPAGAVLVP
ncbi:MAG: DUF192 domain-containing protein [Acidimicrobiia bacterium]